MKPGPGVSDNDCTERYEFLDDIDRIELYYFGVGHTDGT
ncbi:MAG: hypothetical protein Ct9H300mP25_10080 [Acidobacteriota bacterium]|nr:MAG: hypothetical protein Ct9H300mP25_10080 [Acidobacteriota bacterium]